MKDKNLSLLILVVLVAADCAAWFQILAAAPARQAEISFLDVGQGDSILLKLPGNIKMLTDAGPDAAVLKSLDRLMSPSDRYIDLAIITHPELDHFNGFNHIIGSYRIGAFIINGRDHPGSRQWAELIQKIRERNIPLLALGAGDAIRHGGSRIDILSPDPQLIGSSELNDTGLVQKVRTPDFTALLTADIGINVENVLRGRYKASALAADILKVGHHGSKYSSALEFLQAVKPQLAGVSSGARNRYGHPAPEVLTRLTAAAIPVLRTDRLGAITIRRYNGRLKVTATRL